MSVSSVQRPSDKKHSTAIDEVALLTSQVAALEQLLEVYEQAVLEQSGRLEQAHDDLARRLAELAESNAELTKLNERLRHEMAIRKEAEQNLRRSERLASVGTLAAGIAHEINNPLGLILLEAHRASQAGGDPKVVESALEEINGYVRRCAKIVRSVLQFAREETTEKWPESINTVAQQARDLTREEAKQHRVTVEFELADDLPQIVMNPTEVEQVFVNLIHNAIHACAAGGRVTVQTRRGEGSVQAAVSDNGCGMTEEDRLRAFDPFYTKRMREGGTGLGLSTCHGIVSDHGGTIAIESVPGKGTTVTVDLLLEPASGS